MLSNLVKLEHVVGDKVYHFLCDANSPANEAKDALLKFLGYVAKVEADAAALAKQAEDASQPAPEAPAQSPEPPKEPAA